MGRRAATNPCLPFFLRPLVASAPLLTLHVQVSHPFCQGSPPSGCTVPLTLHERGQSHCFSWAILFSALSSCETQTHKQETEIWTGLRQIRAVEARNKGKQVESSGNLNNLVVELQELLLQIVDQSLQRLELTACRTVGFGWRWALGQMTIGTSHQFHVFHGALRGEWQKKKTQRSNSVVLRYWARWRHRQWGQLQSQGECRTITAAVTGLQDRPECAAGWRHNTHGIPSLEEYQWVNASSHGKCVCSETKFRSRGIPAVLETFIG